MNIQRSDLMTNEQKIRNLAVKFFKQFKDVDMPIMGGRSSGTVWQEILNSYGYGDEPKTQAEYVKRLKNGKLIEPCWLLAELVMPNNDRFKFLDIEVIEVDGYDISLVKIGKQFFEIGLESFKEYKPKKKIIYVLEGCDD